MPHSLGSLLFNAASITDAFLGCTFRFPTFVPSKNNVYSWHASLNRYQGDVYSVWSASRQHLQNADILPPGGQRPFTRPNVAIAYDLSRQCALDILRQLWQIHPYRISLMLAFDLLRGAFPALRGYSHAVIIDEVQKSVLSGNFVASQLMWHAAVELLRMACEATVDGFATSNETTVHASARFIVEKSQLEYRLRQDVPTLSDPSVRDLLQEADIFVRSFSGFSSFGLFSPMDCMRIITIFSELLTHLWILSTLTFGATPLPIILLSVALSGLPSLMSWSGNTPKAWDNQTSRLEAQLAAKQEAMRHLAHSDHYRPEVMLFDLGPWILRSWARARKALLGLERRHERCERDLVSKFFSQLYLSGAFSAFEHIPVLLVMNSSASSLGAFTLYRSTLQSIFFTAGTLVQTLRMAFQGIFLMGAFSAATRLQPHLEPHEDQAVPYQPSQSGVSIDIKNVSFTYPGSALPSLRNVSLSISGGETVAIVGCNGSGKTTLAKVLLRIFDFDCGGEILVNGVDVRALRPQEYHAHATAVFQGFSKFSTSVKGNVGVGFVPDMHDAAVVGAALGLAGAHDLVRSLPDGIKTTLDGDVASYHTACEGFAAGGSSSRKPHGLSGGEWQRIAISRAFMRARRPEVELLVFDEPTSSLDAHAQKQFFDTVEQLSRDADGARTKTVVFITHRLSTARRADKIAMMECGSITEFGTHQELLALDGRYAAMYRASV
ncbi:P-loop containing nucleoside triphosphate hydrolase protein [Lenzites betulinus]|nr:P-loop containing nucleoside triphosphate hydrolase protein [Lenzites betulinus]